MKIILTDKMLTWLDEKNIFFFNELPHYKVYGRRLRAGEALEFDDETTVEPYVGIFAGDTVCSIQTMSYSKSPVPLDLRIGRYCSIAEGVTYHSYRHPLEHISTSVFTHDPNPGFIIKFMQDHHEGYDNFYPNPQKSGVTIGNDVWIGRNCVLNPGIAIGTGSVIAAHSVVTRSVPAYSIVGGNPAKPIRMRFDQDIIDGLLDSQWWLYKFTDFKDLDVSAPATFLKDFARRKPDLEEYKPERISFMELCENWRFQ